MKDKKGIRKSVFTLAGSFSNSAGYAGKHKWAFTLAEVLITLGIIGVVAAMTLPTLIQKYQEKVTVNKLKKMYSVLSQACNLYRIDNELEIIPFSAEGAEKVFNIFKPYLKIATDCGTTNSAAGCVYQGMYKKIHGANHVSFSNRATHRKVLLADGSSLIFRGGGGVYANYAMEVFYDVNGGAPPNTWGIDLFEFDFNIENGKLEPNGIGDERFQRYCIAANADGWGCTAWVIFKGNMDYLHCDGLTWDGASSCKDLNN